MKTRIVNIGTTGTAATGRPVVGRPTIFQGVKGDFNM